MDANLLRRHFRIDLQNPEQVGLDIDGLLGLNVLKNFRATLDFERNVLTLAEP